MPQRPTRERVPPIPSTRLAMIALLMSELMLFTGLIGMYLIVRLAAPAWPPPGQPRLPLPVTTLNTLLLFASLVPMTRALRAIQRDDQDAAVRGVTITAGLGATFLVVQGTEWFRLVQHGLTLGSSLYGGAFYLIIGCHAVHVLTAVVWLAVVAALARRHRFSRSAHAGLEMCTIYWYFVSALWAVLFPLVYLY